MFYGSKSTLLALLAVLVAPSAWAYLGGFEAGDGYDNGSSGTLRDVTSYNAGEYGTNAGGPGGSFQNIAPNNGLFTKFDNGNVSPGYGELVGHDTIAHSGLGSLVLRSNAGFGDTTPGDGAQYLYNFDKRDFGGVSPTLVTSGVLTMDYWMCPQTSFFQTGTVCSTSFLNTKGDTIFSIGTVGQGLFTADPFIEWQDANGWHVTSILGNHNGWDRILLAFDLDNGTISFSYYSSLTGKTTILASGVSAASTMDNVSSMLLTAQPDTAKNAFDDFHIVSPLVIPEPSSLIAALVGIGCLMRRRR